MAESRSPRAPARTSGTMRLETVGRDRSIYRTAALVVIVALGGAAVGSLGSQLLAKLTLRQNGTATAGKPRLALLKSDTLEGRLAEVDQALAQHDASMALLLCEEALRQHPSDPQLLSRRKRAEEEQLDRFRFEMLDQAISRRNFAAALALADEISAGSPLRTQAQARIESVLTPFIQSLLDEAERAVKLSLCSEARTILSQVLQLQPQNSRAQEILAACPTN